MIIMMPQTINPRTPAISAAHFVHAIKSAPRSSRPGGGAGSGFGWSAVVMAARWYRPTLRILIAALVQHRLQLDTQLGSYSHGAGQSRQMSRAADVAKPLHVRQRHHAGDQRVQR